MAFKAQVGTQEEDERIRNQLLEAVKLPDLNIAVSGLAGRFPKSDSVNEFEANLRQAYDMVNDEDDSRFMCRLWGLPPRAGRLKDLSRFDASFFGYTQEEANYTDCQMRILYEVVYESILDAGINPASLRGTKTGVFFGLHCNEFENAMAEDPAFRPNGYYGQFGIRVAQYFDFRGMAVTFDAACASGFLGLHNACEALRTGLVDQAVVCSSNIPIHPTNSFIFLQMQMLSPTGYSRFLDSRADGYVKSESCVSVFLQRKDVAIRNYASIMSTMTSVDGFKREGITFPSDLSQERLIREAKERAGIMKDHVEYIEAHGTGTPAGDPQEAKAIARVYCNEESSINEEQRTIGPLLTGSVKCNMGHSEAASGLCALVKVALMLEYELIYPSLHYEQPNANIESLKDGRIQFVDKMRPLRGKVVPLSCYGFGGANVHAIVRANEAPAIEWPSEIPPMVKEEPQEEKGGDIKKIPRLVLMFGRGPSQLGDLFDRMQDPTDYKTRNCLSDHFLALLDSLNSGTIDRLMDHRGFMILDRNSGCELFRSIEKCELLRDTDKRHFQEVAPIKLNLILPGLGSDWPLMAAGLCHFNAFWSTIEKLAEVLETNQANGTEPRVDLLSLLTGGRETSSLCERFTSIVAYQVALIHLFQVKLQPNVGFTNIFGHSLGEVSAAYAAGRLDQRKAILVAHRLGRTLDENQELIAGKMIALEMSEAQILRILSDFDPMGQFSTIAISCLNGPESVTLSGNQLEMELLINWLADRQLHYVLIESSVALHNEQIMTSEIHSRLRKSLAEILNDGDENKSDEEDTRSKSSSASNWISTLVQAGGLENVSLTEYFAASMCLKVHFLGGALEKLVRGDIQNSICLELGSSGIFEAQLRLMVNNNIKKRSEMTCGKNFSYVKAMKRDTKPEQQVATLLTSIGSLYQMGVSMSLREIYPEMNQIRCVGRQTPSLSSLFNWNHEKEHFVPRYPIQFSKSSAKCEIPFDVLQERDKYLLGHCVEGRCLFPATGYLFLIWRIFSFTKRKIYDACFQNVESQLVPIEFRQVKLMRAVILGNKVTQFYMHFEETTGRFEIKEGGTVVVEGWAQSPLENPKGLLYESSVRDRIQAENLKAELNKDDIYKQFRVSGYDYGNTFQNIVEASGDGRYCRVKFNGHFVALTDSILQSIFLAVTQYAPSGGLFLPTGFDYIRFQPDIIIAKMRSCNMGFDLSDNSLNTVAKREIMTKIMEREGGFNDLNLQVDKQHVESAANEQQQQEDETTKEKDCFFDTYCDPITGIIVTDGIEMRGIKATPAPRRSDANELLLESYQFVAHCEEPIEDERLTGFRHGLPSEYNQICDSISIRLIKDMVGSELDLNRLIKGSKQKLATFKEIDQFKSKHLKCQFAKLSQPQNLAAKASNEGAVVQNPDEQSAIKYDIRENGRMMLLSVLEQLECHGKLDLANNGNQIIRELINKNRYNLMNDLIQAPFITERFMRPMMEIVIENVCQRKSKLSLLEINHDDGILHEPLNDLLSRIEPTLSVNYSLAHPDPRRITKLLPSSDVNDVRMIPTKEDIQSLLGDQRSKDMDLIVYKDDSCYSLPKLMVESNCLQPVISSLANSMNRGAFLMLVMRTRLTIAERVLLALSEPELVGFSDSNLQTLKSGGISASECIFKKIEAINSILESRARSLRSQAAENNLSLVSSKADLNGCLALLFRQDMNKPTNDPNIETSLTSDYLMLRVTHQDESKLEEWLSKLKGYFSTPEDTEIPVTKTNETPQVGDKENSQQLTIAVSSNLESSKKDMKSYKIWLCGVDSQEETFSGVIGMMQALRKELGPGRLRCFYDRHTFKDMHEPITMQKIEESATFQLAKSRDLVWNCIDQWGQLGSYRHFTINDYLNYSSCLCDIQSDEVPINESIEPPLVPCYVNYANRGDLSSFTWFEAPFKYLDQEQCDELIRVSYSALNFRDIMLATGRLPLDAIPIRLAMADCLLGLEFSGFDRNNKRVMGMVFGRGLATEVLCPKRSSIRMEIPDWLDLREAATIPVVYATAIMALIYRGKMRLGESILIHAGSGGVGQAAIRLALHFGLEVFTTVGSQEKRNFILEEFGHSNMQFKHGNCLTDDHIFSSRDCNFEWKLMKMTRGRGVDLVLNSLADDKLQASVRCLADGGRFLEIGKYDMSVNARLELLQLDHNKTYHGILLDKLFDIDDISIFFERQLECVLGTLKEGLEKGFVKPIKHTLFKRHQIEEAFRFMATGKHIGKILIEIDTSNGTLDKVALLPRFKCVPRFQLAPTKSHIVTGGLGGFGLELVKWLVNQGARHILITSRSGLRTGYQKITIKRLESLGAQIKIITYDTTKLEGVASLLEEALLMAPSNQIGSIFHLAMVLKDSLLENMTPEDFKTVCQPKIDTCKYLDSELNIRQIKVDYFVAFSSVTSGKGNSGQANYAYANSSVERICEQRRSRGQHALAIQWGAIGDVGAAFENLGGNNVVVGGTIPQRMPSCQSTLSKLLCSPFAVCLSVLPVSRHGDRAAGAKGDLVGAIFHVLGIKDQSKVSDTATLGELGLDSLMAVEIRQFIEREYDMTLNMQEIRALTIGKIREIGEKQPGKKGLHMSEQQSDLSSTGVEDPNAPKIVENYGIQSKKSENGFKNQPNDRCLIDKFKCSDLKVLDINHIAGYKPELILPKRIFKFLNGNSSTTTGSISKKSLSRSSPIEANQKSPCNRDQREPLFFLPPITGSFELLEPICKQINSRRCVGLNYCRSLAHARSIDELVEFYLKALENYWNNRNTNTNQEDGDRIIDLVGYSYGATVAFELMNAIHKQHISNLNTMTGKKNWKPGKLILLDGSPKQTELGSQLMTALNRRSKLNRSEKVDEFLMAYIIAHTKELDDQRPNYLELRDTLNMTPLEDKVHYASNYLCQVLDLLPPNNNNNNTNSSVISSYTEGTSSPSNSVVSSQADSGAASDSPDDTTDEEQSDNNSTSNPRLEMELAMEAFMNRYEIVDLYKCKNSLSGNVTLIRAEKVYLSEKNGTPESTDNDDLGLSNVVRGDVKLHIMAGDHSSFLMNNYIKIGTIIESSINISE